MEVHGTGWLWHANDWAITGAEGQIRDPTSPSVVSYLVAYPLVFRTPFRLCLEPLTVTFSPLTHVGKIA